MILLMDKLSALDCILLFLSLSKKRQNYHYVQKAIFDANGDWKMNQFFEI
jgi:hypothetical protein